MTGMEPPKLIIDEVDDSLTRWKNYFKDEAEVISVVQLNKRHELVTIRTKDGTMTSLLGQIEESTKNPVDIIDACDPEVEQERRMIGKHFPMSWIETTDWWWQRI